MRLIYVIHILAGSLGLLTGYVALFAVKGAPLHRRSGMVFVYTMLTMCVFGLLISVVRGVAPAINIPAGIVTAYMATTGLMTVHPIPGARWLEVSLMLVALTLGLTDLTFGFQALASGTRFGMPAFPFFLFGVAATLGAVGDLRVIRSGPRTGASRLARHLWRMCFALFIAA